MMNRLAGSEYTTPRDLHDKVLQLVTSFFRDDRWVPALQVFGKPGLPITFRMLRAAEMSIPGELMARELRRLAELNHCAAVSVAIPSTRFAAGTARPDAPNFYRLSTVSASEAPLATSWRLRTKPSGKCIKCLPVSSEDNLAEGEHLIAAHWALIFPECPVGPETIQRGAAYYRSTYVEPDGAVHDPAFRSY